MPDSKYNWDSPEDKRQAAMQFLQAVSKKDEPASQKLRELALGSREEARRIFSEIGEIDIPEDVEVICLPNDTEALNKLVVFVLPDDESEVQTPETAFKCWVAAWRAYDREE